jgi:transcriptional regulator of heat shock response
MPYSIGSTRGTIGLVGPKRMDYPRMMALVQQLAARFNQ